MPRWLFVGLSLQPSMQPWYREAANHWSIWVEFYSVRKGAAPSASGLSILSPHGRRPSSERRQTAACSPFDDETLTPSPRELISSSPTVQNHSFATNARHIQPQSTQLTPFGLSRTTPIAMEAQPSLWSGARCHLSVYGPAARRRPHPPAQAMPSSQVTQPPPIPFSASWLSWPTHHKPISSGPYSHFVRLV
ncbi:hypothetical protein LZ30DRAFT_27041 [Colletotrichum cereale]|nr:hypothetical protein LZ30DRAFT_27041 [Colletotrichum cereale]